MIFRQDQLVAAVSLWTNIIPKGIMKNNMMTVPRIDVIVKIYQITLVVLKGTKFFAAHHLEILNFILGN